MHWQSGVLCYTTESTAGQQGPIAPGHPVIDLAAMVRSLLLSSLCATSLLAQPPTAPLRDRIAARLKMLPGASAAVFYRDLGSGETMALNADSAFHAASTMKVPVMIEYFRGVDAGRFAPEARLTLTNRFRSIVDGSPYSLDAGDDSDSALYQRVGQEVAVRELVERMITRSSNLATNVVIELVGAPRAQATARSLGAATMMVRRGVEDNLAYRAGLNNTTSARDLGALFEAIGRGSAASSASTRAMLEVLERQEFNDEIPAGLPRGVRVAHKTGWITGTLHDAALVLPEGRAPFVLVVLTGGIPNQRSAQQLIADIARMAWEHAVGGETR